MFNVPRWLVVLSLLAALLAAALGSRDPPALVHTAGCILITGASTGIGRAAAEALAREAPTLTILAGVRRASDADSVRGVGLPNLFPVELDVTDATSVARALAAAGARGPLVGLVNNAGLARGPTVLEFHELDGDARALFDVNVFGALRITQAALPQLRASRGRVVFVSSIFGALAPPMGGVYSASKFALEALADTLRREAGPLGVSVSVVRPGAVSTPIFASLANSTIGAAARARSPAAVAYAHLHTPADVAVEAVVERLAATTAVTDAAIVHALRAARPRTRYTVANMAGVPAVALEAMAGLLPDRWLDFVMAQKVPA